MKTIVRAVMTTALIAVAFSSAGYANPKCSHQSETGMFASTNPPKKKAIKSNSTQTKTQGYNGTR